MAVDPRSPRPVEAALAYASFGWPVFPVFELDAGGNCSCHRPDCNNPGKHPRTEHGLKDASADAERIAAWWTSSPKANVAIRTGAESGSFVLDDDPGKGGDESLAALEAKHGPLPKTVTAHTGGGGSHRVFAHPGVRVPNSIGFMPGLDVRGDGGYVVASPSNHKSGGTYAWIEGHAPGEIAIAQAPEWLLDLVLKRSVAGADDLFADPPLCTLSENQILSIKSALSAISPDCDRDLWIKVGMALHSTGARDQVFAIWDEWSSKATRKCGDGKTHVYPGTAALRKQWQSFRAKEPEVRLATLFFLAQAAGWRGQFEELGDGRVHATMPNPITLPVEPSEPPPAAKPWVPFPVHVLPEPMRSGVQEMARLASADVGAIAPLVLAVLSGAIGATHIIQPRIGYEQFPTLWALLIQMSGTGKTPTLEQVTAALEVRDSAMRSASAEQVQESARRQGQQEQARKAKRNIVTTAKREARRAEAEAASARRNERIATALLEKLTPESPGYERAKAEHEEAVNAAKEAKGNADVKVDLLAEAESAFAAELPPEKENPAPLVCAKLTDATAEASLYILRHNPRGLTLHVDEANALLRSLGEYKSGGGGSDQERLLRLRDGSRIVVDRLRPNPDGSPGSYVIEHGLMAIAGAATPKGFFKSAAKIGAFDSGLLPRFWLISPPVKVRRWDELADFATPNADKLREIENELAKLPLYAEPQVIGLTESAMGVWEPYVNANRERVFELPEGPIRALRSKLEGDTLRVALILHLFRRQAGDPTLEEPERADAVSMQAAITITNWVGDEFERVLAMGEALTAASPEERERYELIAWIRSRAGGATAREVQNGGPTWARRRKSTLIELQLRSFVTEGYLEAEDVKPAHGPSVTRFRVRQTETPLRQDASSVGDSGQPVASQAGTGTGVFAVSSDLDAAPLSPDGRDPSGAPGVEARENEKQGGATKGCDSYGLPLSPADLGQPVASPSVDEWLGGATAGELHE